MNNPTTPEEVEQLKKATFESTAEISNKIATLAIESNASPLAISIASFSTALTFIDMSRQDASKEVLLSLLDTYQEQLAELKKEIT